MAGSVASSAGEDKVGEGRVRRLNGVVLAKARTHNH
jgi:hypothetical protein